MSERRARLEAFFFNGLPGFEPVIALEHYAGSGGIRSVQSAVNVAGRFYQFRLTRSCASDGSCRAVMQPDSLENMPSAKLFDASIDTPQGRQFRDEFVKQVANLAIDDANLFSVKTSPSLQMVESHPTDSEFLFNFGAGFKNGLASAAMCDSTAASTFSTCSKRSKPAKAARTAASAFRKR